MITILLAIALCMVFIVAILGIACVAVCEALVVAVPAVLGALAYKIVRKAIMGLRKSHA